MLVDPVILVVIGCVVAVWLFVRWRASRSEFPPMNTSPDDPLMVEALEKAKQTRGQFLSLARAANESLVVKLRFVSNSNQVEHLWAEVLEALAEEELRVRLVTKPVTHAGHLDRVYRCSVDDVEDWQALDDQGKILGGFTQRAMFAIARRDGIKLPRKLLALEQEYKDAPQVTSLN